MVNKMIPHQQMLTQGPWDPTVSLFPFSFLNAKNKIKLYSLEDDDMRGTLGGHVMDQTRGPPLLVPTGLIKAGTIIPQHTWSVLSHASGF